MDKSNEPALCSSQHVAKSQTFSIRIDNPSNFVQISEVTDDDFCKKKRLHSRSRAYEKLRCLYFHSELTLGR